MTRKRALGLILAAVTVAIAGSAIAIAKSPNTIEDIFGNQQNETSKEQITDEDAALRAIGQESPAPTPEDPEAARPTDDPGDVLVC